jgi:hypothetical protein
MNNNNNNMNKRKKVLRKVGSRPVSLPGGGGLVRISRPIAPDRAFVTMTYYNEWFYGSSSPNYEVTLQLNSIANPEASTNGTSHRPMGYSQWSSMYNRYRVWGVDVFIEVNNRGNYAMRLMFVPNATSGTLTNTFNGVEQGFPARILSAVGSSTACSRYKRSTSMPRIAGCSRQRYGSDDVYQANFGSNPINLMFGHISVSLLDSPVDLSVDISFRLFYHVECYERAEFASTSLPSLEEKKK